MRNLILALLITGCTGSGSVAYHGSASAGYGYYEPDLVYVSPGVQVIADYDEPIFYTDGFYWRYYGGTWYRSRVYTGGWSYASAPRALLRIERPHAYVRYRPQGYVSRRPAYRDRPGYRDNRPVYRDNRTYQQPEVRDHRTPYRQPEVRDQRTPEVRDHRTPYQQAPRAEERREQREERREQREDRREERREQRDDRRDDRPVIRDHRR